jgi:enoyl-CoA hydratase
MRNKEGFDMSKFDNIQYEVEGPIAMITLDRVRYRNALSDFLMSDLDSAFKEAVKDRDVRVVTLFGAGDHFSGGHDLGSPQRAEAEELNPTEEGIRGKYRRSWDFDVERGLRWRSLEKPLIAAVQGYCIFAAWAVASCADVIFASDNALFLPSNFQYFSVPWDIHHRKAKEILFESRFIDAEEAQSAGLVNRIYPVGDLKAETLAYAQRVSENDPFQLRMMKMAVNQALDIQGFTAHVQGSYAHYSLSANAEKDPGYALSEPDIKRRPNVQRALDHYWEEQARKDVGD